MTYDITTTVGKIRLKIGDKTAPYVFTDAEITEFYTQAGSINLAAADALEAWASTYGANADSEHIGDYSYTQRIIDNMLKLAERLRKLESETPSITWAEPNLLMTEEAE